MSVNDDCELHDLVKQTLEKSGSISKIRAELRASIFLALQENDCFQSITCENHELQKFAENDDGILLLCLVREFLDFYGLSFTVSVFDPELASYGIQCNLQDHKKLQKKLNLPSEIHDGKHVPFLYQILRKFRRTQSVSNGETHDKQNIENSLSPSSCQNDLTTHISSHITNPFDTFNEIKNMNKKFEINNEESPVLRSSSKLFSLDTKSNLISSDFSKNNLSLLGNLPPLSAQCHTSRETLSNESTKQLNKLKAILKDSALSVNDESNSSIFSGDDDDQFREIVQT